MRNQHTWWWQKELSWREKRNLKRIDFSHLRKREKNKLWPMTILIVLTSASIIFLALGFVWDIYFRPTFGEFWKSWLGLLWFCCYLWMFLRLADVWVWSFDKMFPRRKARGDYFIDEIYAVLREIDFRKEVRAVLKCPNPLKVEYVPRSYFESLGDYPTPEFLCIGVGAVFSDLLNTLDPGRVHIFRRRDPLDVREEKEDYMASKQDFVLNAMLKEFPVGSDLKHFLSTLRYVEYELIRRETLYIDLFIYGLGWEFYEIRLDAAVKKLCRKLPLERQKEVRILVYQRFLLCILDWYLVDRFGEWDRFADAPSLYHKPDSKSRLIRKTILGF